MAGSRDVPDVALGLGVIRAGVDLRAAEVIREAHA